MLTWIREFLGIYKKPNNVVEPTVVEQPVVKQEIPAPLPEVKVEQEVKLDPVPVEKPIESSIEEIKKEQVVVEKITLKAEPKKTQQKARKPRKKKNGASS